MNSAWHFYISVAKSVIRIMGCAYTIFTKDVMYMAVFFTVAEVFGLLEEVGDER